MTLKPTPENLSQMVARVMPRIIQGVHLDFLAGRSITHTQFLVIVAVHSYGNCPMKSISKNMHVSMPTTTGIIDRLVKAGYVQRFHDPGDRRQVMVRLSGKGRNFIADFQKVVGRRWAEVLSFFTKEDLQIFSGILRKLEEVLNLQKISL